MFSKVQARKLAQGKPMTPGGTRLVTEPFDKALPGVCVRVVTVAVSRDRASCLGVPVASSGPRAVVFHAAAPSHLHVLLSVVVRTTRSGPLIVAARVFFTDFVGACGRHLGQRLRSRSACRSQ